jgi:ABC-type spermidine/putrescine transport system permease subunit II
MTFSWDEFVISFLLTRFDTTLPVEIWNLLRSGLNPRTNAAQTHWRASCRHCHSWWYLR